MSTINAQSIINAVMQAHAIAPVKTDSGFFDKIKFQTSERGFHSIQNSKENLQKFADLIRKNSSIFGGGLTREAKPRPAVSWPSNLISIWKTSIEDQDWQAALDIGEKLGALFFLTANGTAFMQVAPIPVDTMPGCSSVLNESGKYAVICPISMRCMNGQSAIQKRSRAAQIENCQLLYDRQTQEIKDRIVNQAESMRVNQEHARSIWLDSHGLNDARATQARIYAQAKFDAEREESKAKRQAEREALATQDVAQVVATAAANAAIETAMQATPAAVETGTPAVEITKKSNLETFLELQSSKMTCIRHAQTRRVMHSRVKYDGQIMQSHAWIELIILSEGRKTTVKQENKIKDMTRLQSHRSDNEEQRAHEKRVRDAGTKSVYYAKNDSGSLLELSFTEYLYAQFLEAMADSAEPELCEAVTTCEAESASEAQSHTIGHTSSTSSAWDPIPQYVPCPPEKTGFGDGPKPAFSGDDAPADDVPPIPQSMVSSDTPATTPEVSSVNGQKHLCNRAGRIASLKLMNEQIRKIDASEAWHDSNIENETDLDSLQDRISTCLVSLQRLAVTVTDLEFSVYGMFTSFAPNTPAGVEAWKVMARENNGTGKVLNEHAESTIRQLTNNGYTVAKAQKSTIDEDALIGDLAPTTPPAETQATTAPAVSTEDKRKQWQGFAHDISSNLAQRAFNGVSMSPERRGASAQNEYGQAMAADYDTMHAQAIKGGTLALLPEVFARYRARQAGAFNAYLSSSSRCVSSFIAGPSNFPVARMNKRNDIAHKRLTEYLDGGKMALRAAIRTLRPDLRAIMSGDVDAIDRLTIKIESAERAQNQMKAANKAIRANAKLGEAHQVSALMELGFSERQAIEVIKPDFCGRIGFASYNLTNNNANIRRMKERLEQISKAQATEVQAVECSNGVTLEDDAPANRVRLYFPGKPSDEIRTELKSNGFRWAPSVGAWQAYRNYGTLATARRMAGEPVQADETSHDAAPEAEIVPAVEIEATPPVVESQPVATTPEMEKEVTPEQAKSAPTVETLLNAGFNPAVADSIARHGIEAYGPMVQAEIVAKLESMKTPIDETTEAPQGQQVKSKSGKWSAWLYLTESGLFGLRFNAHDATHIRESDTAKKRMDELTWLAKVADSVPPNQQTDTPPGGGLPCPSEPVTPPASETSRVDAPYTPSAVSSAAPGTGVAVSSEFERVKPFNLDPRALLDHGAKIDQLIGLGVKYTGDYSSPGSHGAVTDAIDSRGVSPGGELVLICTLENGTLMHANPFYFTAQLRPILQFDGKMHGSPYLAELATTAALATSKRTSADELKKQAHAKELINLAAQYQQLKKAESTYAGGKIAAVNARILLKQAFNGIKFSVTSDHNSLRIEWLDGPTDAQVTAIVGRFDIGASDTQSDYFYTVSTAFSNLFGGVQYMHTKRNTSDALIQEAINQVYALRDEKPTVLDYRKCTGVFDWDGSNYENRRMREALETISKA